MPLEGYKRNSSMTASLSMRISIAMTLFPTQRLGQIIRNAVPPDTDLFNLHDEDLNKYLDDYCGKYGGK